MGNDQSKLKGLQIDKNAVEVNDFWSLYNAEIPNDDSPTLLSIFQEEPVVNGQLWLTQTPLKRAIKNLMIYRHPCILKYVTSWEQGSKRYLATERCQPLSSVIQSQSDIQICLGLKNILSSLIFLVEQAKTRHLNICMLSIFVNTEGEWRLGGFEFLWKTKEITKNLFDLVRPYRYDKAIDQYNEIKNNNTDTIEQYSFGIFCEELLKNRKNSDTPYVQEFYDYCITHLKHQNITMRPKLSAILLHPYFNHEFILIHSFLMELPLKGPQEKQDFFTGLIDRLRYFDENIVASQIGNLLLSRMVLLDTTAQLCVTPYVLKTKTDISSALFSHITFKKYIIPRIKQIFYVRDAQIRLILLEYFNEYVKLMTKDELKDKILPNLLLGIKDTNDILVSKTLRCLADLVPILGSQNVIGGTNRKRLFADGRPQGCYLSDNTRTKHDHWIEPRSITPVVMTSGEYIVSASPLPSSIDNNCDTISESFVSMTDGLITTTTATTATPTTTTTIIITNNNSNNPINDNIDNLLNIMPERLSPDGGEDIQTTAIDCDIVEDDDDAWSDWDNDEIRITATNTAVNTRELSSNNVDLNPTTTTTETEGTIILNEVPLSETVKSSIILENPQKTQQLEIKQKQSIEQIKSASIDDINSLDIKNQKFKPITTEEIDFFKDMEPVIQSTSSNLLIQNQKNDILLNKKKLNDKENESKISDDIEVDKSRFAIKIDDDNVQETGWDDAENDWEV